MIERSHLKIIRALADNGTLTAAANALYLTQPALSHQIRYLEKKLDVTLWQREGRQLRLTDAGNKLLAVAQQVLPVLEQTEKTLMAYGQGRQGVMRIGVECHPCYQWLTRILADFLVTLPDIDVDIVNQFQFSGIEGLLNHHVDLLVTPDKVAKKGMLYQPLFDYELVLLVSRQNALSKQTQLQAEDLLEQTLLTFPVAHERLDVFTQFLLPAGVTPSTKAIASLDIMVQMVRLNRGVTALPAWLAQEYSQQFDVSMIRLGQTGIHKTLFAAIREADVAVSYLKQFISLGQSHKLD